MPRNENERLLTPPLTFTPGHACLISRVGLDEVLRELVVLLDARRDGEDVRVEDDVGGIEARVFGQQRVGALADRDLALDGLGLPLLVERHHDDAGAVPADQLRLGEEVRLAFLQADRVDDGLALDALEAGLDDRPLRAVDHERHARHFRLGRQVVQERRHGALGVEHAFVHVDVDDVGAAAHLVERDLRRPSRSRSRLNQARELRRAGDVGPLADHLEVAVGANRQRLEARELGISSGWPS